MPVLSRAPASMKTALATVVALAAVLAACDRSADKAGPSGDKPAAASSRNRNNSNAAASGEPVAAVLQSQGKPVVALNFLIDVRPVLGQPFAMKLLVTADQPVPQLQLAAESATMVVAPATGEL